jgi:transcriptional regulator with XRE-family HTH domain
MKSRSRELAAFGERLRAARHERGVSQEALGFDADLDRTAISRLEQGACEPRLGSILRVARALGIKPGVLLDCL